MTAGEVAAFQTAAFTTRGGAIVAYWVGLEAVDSFADKSVSVSLPSPITDPILIDPVAGTYSTLGSGPVGSFTLRVQDYPLILTSGSALENASPPLILAEETYNYPNPVRSARTTLRFYLTRSEGVTLEIYNSARALVHSSAVHGAVGRNVYTWDAGNAANGVYYWKVTAGGQSVVKKILVLK